MAEASEQGFTQEALETVVCRQCEGAGRFESKFEKGKYIRCDRCEGAGNVKLTAAEAERLAKIRAGESSANPAQHLVALLKRSQKALVKLAGENPSEDTVSLVADIAKALAVDTLIKKGALDAVRNRLSKANSVIGLTGLPDAPSEIELLEAVTPLLLSLNGVARANQDQIFTHIGNFTKELHKLWTVVKEAETEW